MRRATSVAALLLASACGTPEATTPTSEAGPDANASGTPSPSASPAAAQSDAIEVRLTSAGVDYGGNHYNVLDGGRFPTTKEGAERIAPAVRGWLEAVDAHARARHEKNKSLGERPDPMPLAFVVEQDVHPTTLFDIAALTPDHAGGVMRFRLWRNGASHETPLETFSAASTPGPKPPEGWGCAGIQQPLLEISLAARGDPAQGGRPSSLAPVMLRHGNGGAPDWARFERDVAEARADATCFGWIGAGDRLKFEELVDGIATIWKVRKQKLPVVYVPFDGPEE